MIESTLMQKFVFVIALGVFANWFATLIRAPAIVLLCAAGILVGPVLGWINPPQDFGGFDIVMVKLAVSVILFEGGLNLRLYELKTSKKGLWRLVLFGLPLAWTFGSLAAHFIAGLSWPVSLVIGAILVVTGPTVIMPLIRTSRLSPRVASLMKWEGIVNDPLGALLAVLVYEFYLSSSFRMGSIEVLISLGSAVGVAAVVGIGVGYGVDYAFKNAWVVEYLKVPVILSLVMGSYGFANMIQDEAGLLAVTIFGFVIGNTGLKIIEELRRFKEYITVFLVSAVFVLLTASLHPQSLELLNWRSAGFFAAVLFIVRPASIWISTIGAGLSWRERALLGWIAPRGVVAATVAGLFASKMVERGYPDAELMVPLVFSVIVLTVVLHGFSLRFVSRKLGLSSHGVEGILIVGASPWSTELALAVQKLGVPIRLVDSSWHRLRDARLKGVPVHYGEILSENSEERLDLSDMGYLLATSENDAYNALVSSAFAPHFGRDRVFQLALHTKADVERGLRTQNRGRIAFSEHLHYEKLLTQFYQGWRFQVTTITQEFSFEDFLKASKKVEPLILLQKKGSLIFDTSRREVTPAVGDVLLSYSEPDPDSDGSG